MRFVIEIPDELFRSADYQKQLSSPLESQPLAAAGDAFSGGAAPLLSIGGNATMAVETLSAGAAEGGALPSAAPAAAPAHDGAAPAHDGGAAPSS